MQVKNISVHEFLGKLRLNFQEDNPTRKYANEEPPLRAELFTIDQLAQHGAYLAKSHQVQTGHSKERLLRRLAENEQILIDVRDLLTDAIKENGMVTPAGEWLLDNFYLIEDHIRTGKRHLPKGYSTGLPRLTSTASEGLPRVYDIALEVISHSDGRIDLESLSAFIQSYQTVTQLQLGELWAIPIMLRLALIENLRRVAARIAIDRINNKLADYWAGLMTETAEKDPKSLILVIADMARSGPPLESSFVAELIRQLMWKGPSLALPLTWMEQRLAETGVNSNELVNMENQKQAADQVSISNTIGSLRLLGGIEWREFVESMSVVEHTLRNDASGVYPSMDFATRDRYRHIVERIAKNSKLSENEVANIAIQLARRGSDGETTDKRMEHVGYYLTGDGLIETERLAQQELPWGERIKKSAQRNPLIFYAGNILFISLLVTAYLLWMGYREGVSPWILTVLGLVAFTSTSHLATSIVNWLATLWMRPELLPRLDFSEGIRSDCTTLVVVPTMLVNPAQVAALAEALEVRFLANRDSNLHFGLLTDFTDANSETIPGDDDLLAVARTKIEELNRKYADNDHKFFLFHRPRKWNPHDKIWMGYERKRGKLGELNDLLRGKGAENFSLIVGDLAGIGHVKYVITLDTDTQLPRDAAWKLVGTMAHPLNQAYYDPRLQRVTKGYGILQPRVSVSLPRSGGSMYALIHGSEPGIDPYTRLTSDVYQDLFEEGSFIGKGIYEIDAFEQALAGRLPENRILSHDLLEGCYTRSGLVSDVELFEEYPKRYSSDVNRRHRWIRGDWQIAYWSLPWAPDGNRKLRKNPLSLLSRWKISDNLRRSLVPAALTTLLFMGWTVLHDAWFWTTAVLLMILLPSLIAAVYHVFHKPREITFWQHAVTSLRLLADTFFQAGFMFICLPYEAYYSLDAILRTGWRMTITKRKLLEWNPSGNEQNNDRTISQAYRSMWFSPFTAVVSLACIIVYSPYRLFFAGPIVIMWALSPFVAWLLSKPFPKDDVRLTESDVDYIRRIARKTWGFFERFVGDEDNWLPVDNYQQHPNNVVAHRTSPTNIGLCLLSNLTAHDFGYITTGTMLTRTANTFNTLDKMERYRKHLYNWYDTETLKPLHPKYISTVDSGNFAGHLLTLKQGLYELSSAPIASSKLFAGLADTLGILEQEMPVNGLIRDLRTNMQAAQTREGQDVEQITRQIAELGEACTGIRDRVELQADSDAAWWLQTLIDQCTVMLTDLRYLYTWFTTNVPERFRGLYDGAKPATLHDLVALEITLLSEVDELAKQSCTTEEEKWLTNFKKNVRDAANHAADMISEIDRLAAKCEEYADLDYDFLYDKSKHLLTIGYNVDDHVRDGGSYDLLASEANLTSFVAIAQGKIPQENWFALGRLLTMTKTAPVLLSWSGSMFEYLMPMLVMPSYEGTLIDQTHKAAVARQIEYGNERDVPWGISESGYNMVDANLNYQYHAFGVPGLGLKRGLAEDLVIAPYASALALMVAPEAACKNMKRLSREGFEGRYGLYEAIDFTPSRVPRGQTNAVIQSFMAHHQGMSLLSFAYTLLGQPMQRRFEAELQFQATILLLQERIPRISTFYSHSTDIATIHSTNGHTEMRVINTPHTPIPEIQLLSNGRYNVMITNSGGGYSRWKDMAVTRWREDGTCDNWGTFCYIRDLEDGNYWSNAHQPALVPTKRYEATFTQGRAEFRRRDNQIETHTEIVVSPEDDIEMRRVHISNRSRKKRTIDVTTYAEVVLTSAAADASHPAFSNLFIQTEIIEPRHAIICTRRPRTADERIPSMFHLVTVHGVSGAQASYETDRSKFIGRANSIINPVVMSETGPLSNSQGAVLDPIVSVRYELTLEPDESVIVDIITGVGETKDACHALIDKYQDKHHKDRVFELAWTHSQVVLRQINATEADAQQYGALASSIIFANPALRAEPAVILSNNRGQSGLWGYAVSGDLPIVLLEIEDQANIELAKQLVQAHAYWRLKGLAVDLVIWNEDHGGYRQVLQNQILGLVAAGAGAELSDRPGGIFVRAADQVSNEDRILFRTVARIVISDRRGTLEDHMNRKMPGRKEIPQFTPTQTAEPEVTDIALPTGLQLFNGTGGFSAEGNEYVIITGAGRRTPAPWVNVLANPNFGTVVSESGQAYTWITNAHEFRLTPWDNDPVCDKGGEAIYLRDEDTGYYWSPTPLPITGLSSYITRHGFGYSVFEHIEDGISTELTVFTDIEAPVKFFLLKIKNISGRQRRLSATGFVEWVMGDLKPKTAMHVITESEPTTGAIYARNPYNTELGGYIGFFDTDDKQRTFTADRTEFIGRNGSRRVPEAMQKAKLTGRAGAALDPCAALQTVFTLAEGQEREVVFRLGAGRGMHDAVHIVERFKGVSTAKEALQKVKTHWQHTLSSLRIKTPDNALNLLTNGWLIYQTIACRIWARSGYYQSGGAFGFRDQLQDTLAVMQTRPELARQQIMLCASRQFREGDVQHWWHPPMGRGVRTRCSDDLLWLPFVTCSYVQKTKDTGVLDEQVSFLDGRMLNAEEHSYYDMPVQSTEAGTIYDHCMRAIDKSLQFGVHGLPLIGYGDWNDGMDMVGKDNKGESVWLAFFQYDVLQKFIPIAEMRGDNATAERYKTEAIRLRDNIELNAWDGNWYRRAYFDDGTPLGSATNDECQIDSISQSWAILSGAGTEDRARQALGEADKRLVKTDKKLIQLLDPPFDKSALNPGYIKGYVPGIRENGGQYTHAAIWLIMAHARLGNAERAWELLSLINPLNHALDEENVNLYKTEPYVSAADVYSVAPNAGRGGWTWYTGSAGWTYQLITEWLLGIKQEGTQLRFSPCIPAAYLPCTITYRYYSTEYEITLQQGKGVAIDGAQQEQPVINLIDDSTPHKVIVGVATA